MSVVGALLEALDAGLVVFKTDSGLVVAGHPWDLDKNKIAALMEAEMVWDQDDLAEARKLA